MRDAGSNHEVHEEHEVNEDKGGFVVKYDEMNTRQKKILKVKNKTKAMTSAQDMSVFRKQIRKSLKKAFRAANLKDFV